jgi:tRNA threonylcarbamoyladenosine biosynthesis protein TsaE
MSNTRRYVLPDQAGTEALGARLARVPGALVIFLHGDLGAGKTTLVRGLLRALGHAGPVPSPTYTLLEPYALRDRHCLHLDLYRLGDPEELDYLGLRELMDGDVLVLIEWPERGAGALPPADLELRLDYDGDGRAATLHAASERGQAALELVDHADKSEHFDENAH